MVPAVPVGWATVVPGVGRTTDWRTGQRADALAVLCMLATEAQVAGSVSCETKSPRLVVSRGRSGAGDLGGLSAAELFGGKAE